MPLHKSMKFLKTLYRTSYSEVAELCLLGMFISAVEATISDEHYLLFGLLAVAFGVAFDINHILRTDND